MWVGSLAWSTCVDRNPLQNQVQPPALLALALPHLPPPLPSLITNGLGYLRMGKAFLDDMAAIVFGIGMIILITSWFAD